MKRFLGVLLAVGLAALVSADGDVNCSTVGQSCQTDISCSETVVSVTAQTCVSTPTPSPTPAPSSLLTGLVSYWTMDEFSSGGAAVQRDDAVGSAHLADQNNTPSAVGLFSNAVSFTAASSQKLSYAGDVLPAGTGSFSVAIWVYQAGDSYQPAFWNGVGATEYATIYLDNNGTPGRAGFWVFDGTAYTSGQILTVPTTTQWHLLIGVYDSAAKQAYVSWNGSALTSTVGPNASARSNGGTISQLGYSPVSAQYATNKQDQFVVWNRALSASDVAELWGGGSGVAYADFSGSLSTGITHAYLLDEESSGASASRADAVSSNTLAGNDPPSATGKIGRATDFTSASSDELTNTATSFNPGHTDFTVAGWVFFKDNGNNNFFWTQGTLGGSTADKVTVFRNSVGLGVTGNRIGASIGNGATQAILTGPVAASGWRFVVLSHDTVANRLYLYVDNDAGSSVATGAAYPPSGNDVQAGAGLGFFSDVLIDELAIWSRVLTSDERACLYAAGAAVQYPFTGVCN